MAICRPIPLEAPTTSAIFCDISIAPDIFSNAHKHTFFTVAIYQVEGIAEVDQGKKVLSQQHTLIHEVHQVI